MNILKFYYKYCHNLVPAFFQEFNFVARSQTHQYNTRSKNNLQQVKTRTKIAEKCLRHGIPNITNNTDPLILDKINTHSLHGFVIYTKQLFINSYQLECTISDSYICNH